MKGEWRPIVGFSDYEISSEGEIKSKERSKIYKSGRTVFFRKTEKITETP